MYALIDCNNFYASCERLFRPDLIDTPIVILSNNDGCVIARSNEAKALGIVMGTPFFKVKALCHQHNVQVFSSNYTLYGDISHRIMSILADAWPDVEVYSIDEAFLDLTALAEKERLGFCERLQKRVLQYTGIPTSFGIGQTKTLAKIANNCAKKIFKSSVFNITGQELLLNQLAIDEVWGIGRQWAKKLMALNINTAGDLARCDPHFLKTKFSVMMMRTALELNGIRCLKLETVEPRKSIVSSKSFGCLQTELPALQNAISSYVARAHEKLRRDNRQAQQLSVFVQSSRFRADLAHYNKEISVCFVHPTDDLRKLTDAAKTAINRIFKAGIHYQKIGVMLFDLQDKTHQQNDFFNPINASDTAQTEKLMRVFETVNQRFGRHTLTLAAQGKSQPWSMKRALKSPNYTTNWKDLLCV